MVFTTSYMEQSICDLITSFVRALNPKTAVEIGAQQGHSATLITKGMDVGTKFATFDLFEAKYTNPPYSNTHAKMDVVADNLRASMPLCNWEVCKGSYTEALSMFPDGVDLLHVDICNHYDNLKPILTAFEGLVHKGMILEGGIPNHWQGQHHYDCWDSILHEPWFANNFSYITIPFRECNSVTLLTKIK